MILVAQEEKSPKSLRFIVWEPWMSLANPFSSVDVDIFYRINDQFDPDEKSGDQQSQ